MAMVRALGAKKRAEARARTHCAHGHPYAEAGWREDKRGRRACNWCEEDRRFYASLRKRLDRIIEETRRAAA